MKQSKRAKLETKGWKVGSAYEFLDLTAEEAAYVEMKIALSEKLKQRRQTKRMTQAELARLLRSSQSRVAKMEAGDPSVSIDLLVKSLLALGLSKKELGRSIS
ncbi:MAG TPA: helix-turn-helix transcriptional regulator [Gammaproteobacteria bacterium]|jgi:predicted XRE-type DNA-binding protein